MTRSSAWSEFESGEGLGLRALRFFLIVGGIFFLCFTGILELTWPQQIILGLLTTFVAIWMDRSSSSYLVTLTLMFVSMFSTFRYGYWRISTTVKFFMDPGTQWSPLDAFFISLLVLAEGVRLHHSLSGLLADALAASPHARTAARRPRHLAFSRPAHPHV